MHRFQPYMITNALLALRAELVRDGGPGLEHVEALLVLRGSNLPPVPRKVPMRFRRDKLKAAIREALRDGPLSRRELVQRVSDASGEPYDANYRSVGAQLSAMRAKGQVRHADSEWALLVTQL